MAGESPGDVFDVDPGWIASTPGNNECPVHESDSRVGEEGGGPWASKPGGQNSEFVFSTSDKAYDEDDVEQT